MGPPGSFRSRFSVDNVSAKVRESEATVRVPFGAYGRRRLWVAVGAEALGACDESTKNGIGIDDLVRRCHGYPDGPGPRRYKESGFKRLCTLL